MDFIIDLPKPKGNNVIIVFVNRLTKYAHFCALSHHFRANPSVETFMDIVWNLHGNPKIVVSDRDLIFIGKFWIDLFFCLGTQLAHSSSYHPQSNGKIEIVNKLLQDYLHYFSFDKQT